MNRSGVRVPKKAQITIMLMFESSIFASFIPQIIMVLGYLSCVFGPQFFKSTQQQELAPTATIEYVQAESKLEQNKTVEFKFFQDVFVDNKNRSTVIYIEIRKKEFVVPRVHFRLSIFSFRLFSRPPPYYC